MSTPRRVQLRDAALVAAVGGLTAADLASNVSGSREDDWFSWLVYVLSLAALVVWRAAPLTSAVVTGAGAAAWTLYGHVGELLNLPVMLALYGVAVGPGAGRRRSAVTGAVAALASGVVAVVSGQEEGRPIPSPVADMIWPLIPLLLGEVVRSRRELTEHHLARAELEAARRVREERVRIARELHDVVAHTVSAMTVQAGVALDALDRRPELARSALRQVRASGREAVRELRATVAVLREGDEPGPDAATGDGPSKRTGTGTGTGTGPTPRLDHLPELVERTVGAGDRLRVTLDTATGDRPFPAAVELAAYRIVQEALTNVLRHAHARHAAVTVRAAAGGGPLTVEVVDDGTNDAPAASPGFGLLGMRERAAAVGGTLVHGHVPGGGFRVRAELPVAELPRDPRDEPDRPDATGGPDAASSP
ncbi:sensor histidine kinase [Streptomyces sp. 4N509B]|uniref:sensor histidine kinase n=1 Tax=Streptomyces sp. 4N509B TaxID=3457413 RepID=UPI003FD38D8A